MASSFQSISLKVSISVRFTFFGLVSILFLFLCGLKAGEKLLAGFVGVNHLLLYGLFILLSSSFYYIIGFWCCSSFLICRCPFLCCVLVRVLAFFLLLTIASKDVYEVYHTISSCLLIPLYLPYQRPPRYLPSRRLPACFTLTAPLRFVIFPSYFSSPRLSALDDFPLLSRQVHVDRAALLFLSHHFSLLLAYTPPAFPANDAPPTALDFWILYETSAWRLPFDSFSSLFGLRTFTFR